MSVLLLGSVISTVSAAAQAGLFLSHKLAAQVLAAVIQAQRTTVRLVSAVKATQAVMPPQTAAVLVVAVRAQAEATQQATATVRLVAQVSQHRWIMLRRLVLAAAAVVDSVPLAVVLVGLVVLAAAAQAQSQARATQEQPTQAVVAVLARAAAVLAVQA